MNVNKNILYGSYTLYKHNLLLVYGLWHSVHMPELEYGKLWGAVRHEVMVLCLALGVAIPVGKDSMSMAMQW